MYSRYILYEYAYYRYYYVGRRYARTDSLVWTYILYPLPDLGNLTPGANKNTAPQRRWMYEVCRVSTQNQMFKYKSNSIFLYYKHFSWNYCFHILFHVHLRENWIHSITRSITQYPTHILKFYSWKLIIQ